MNDKKDERLIHKKNIMRTKKKKFDIFYYRIKGLTV